MGHQGTGGSGPAVCAPDAVGQHVVAAPPDGRGGGEGTRAARTRTRTGKLLHRGGVSPTPKRFARNYLTWAHQYFTSAFVIMLTLYFHLNFHLT